MKNDDWAWHYGWYLGGFAFGTSAVPSFPLWNSEGSRYIATNSPRMRFYYFTPQTVRWTVMRFALRTELLCLFGFVKTCYVIFCISFLICNETADCYLIRLFYSSDTVGAVKSILVFPILKRMPKTTCPSMCSRMFMISILLPTISLLFSSSLNRNSKRARRNLSLVFNRMP